MKKAKLPPPIFSADGGFFTVTFMRPREEGDPVKNKILELIKSNPHTNYEELSKKVGVSTSTIKRHIQKLKSDGVVERFGSDKAGGYSIKF